MKTKITESVSQPELAWQCSRSKIGWRCDDINLKKRWVYVAEKPIFAYVSCIHNVISKSLRSEIKSVKSKRANDIRRHDWWCVWIHNGGKWWWMCVVIFLLFSFVLFRGGVVWPYIFGCTLLWGRGWRVESSHTRVCVCVRWLNRRP